MIEAHFDHEDGVVTVFEGRREFKALERAARAAGLPKTRSREYLPYRMLEVEVAANAVYAWAAEQIVSRRLAGEGRLDAAEFAAAVRYEAQALRHRAHEKLMRAFLDPEGLRRQRADPGRGSGAPIEPDGADAGWLIRTNPISEAGAGRRRKPCPEICPELRKSEVI